MPLKPQGLVSLPRDRRQDARNAALTFIGLRDKEMLTTETLDKTTSLLEHGYTYSA
jgi:hypothetical protein